MPYKVRRRGDKYRLLDDNGLIAKNKKGTAIDGGGKKSKAAVEKQARAIMANEYGSKTK